MTSKSIVIIYDSQYGNTKHLAEIIGEELQTIGAVQYENARDEALALPAEMMLLLVGGPTQMHNVSSPLRTQLDGIARHALDGVPTATFDTRVHGPRVLTGAASQGIAKRLKDKGALMIVPPESFIVSGTEGPLAEGELERARTWARAIATIVAPAPAMVT